VKSKRRAVSVVTIVILAGSVLTLLVRGWTADHEVEAETVEVVRRTFASAVVALGAVKPQIGAEVRVGSRISGRVRNLAANVGDRVERSRVIAELETEEYDAAVAERQADLRFAESALAAAEAFDPGSVARAEAELEQAKATSLLAAEGWERYQKLRQLGLAASVDADAMLERHRVAQAQLEAAQQALTLARSGGAEQRRQAAASVERARAALDSAIVQRSFTSIRAPISGVVASVATQEGETVAAGLNAPTFLTIVDLNRLYVEAYVDEVDIGKIVPGLKVTFTVDAFPAKDFSGRVTAVYPSATIQDNVVRYVTAVEIESDYGGLLRPEMTANVRIVLESRDVPAIPARAVHREGNRNVVYVPAAEHAEARPVRIGWREGIWVEVVEGLAMGDRVFTDPPATVKGGYQ
jgi:macrolide-specific efflux system membrane fusion protein